MSDTDRKKLAEELRAELAEALEPTIARVVDLVYPPEVPEPTEPEPTQPNISVPVLAITGGEWDRGISIQTPRFVVTETPEGKASLVEGALLQFADGTERKVKKVLAAHRNLYVEYEGSKVAPDKNGHPNVIVVKAAGGASPTNPEPEPDTPPVEEFVPLTVTINDFNGKPDFDKGVWVGSDVVRVSVPVTARTETALAVGAKVMLADGKVRTVTQLETLDKNHSVTMDGPKLDPAVVGHPGSLTTVPADAKDMPPVEVPPTPEQSPAKPKGPGLINLNLGLGQGGDSVLPGRHNTNYAFPNLDEWKLAASQGFKRARVGFLWERAFPGGAGRGKLDSAHLQLMHDTAAFAKQVGMTILWDMHNYSGYSTTSTSANRQRIGTPAVPINALGDDWKVLAAALMANPTTKSVTYGFDIMNEPIISWATWKPAAQHAITSIAAVSDAIVVVEGINYSNTTNWVTNNPGMETLVHPKGKEYLEFQGHLYLDNGQDGFWTDAVETQDKIQPGTARNRLRAFREWGAKHGLKLGIGETMVPGIYPKHLAELDILLGECVEAGIDVYVFFAARGAGANWHNINKPENKPSLDIILKHVKK